MKYLWLSLIAVTGVISVADCEEREHPDLSKEKHLLSAEASGEREEEKKHKLFRLDEALLTELQNPTAPELSFEVQLKILKNLVDYHNRLYDVLVGVRNDTTKKVNLANEIVKKDGPSFIKEPVNEDKLKEVYNWDEENLEFFRDYMQDVKFIWNNITIALQEKPTPLEIFFTKKVGYFA